MSLCIRSTVVIGLEDLKYEYFEFVVPFSILGVGTSLIALWKEHIL